jgi:hypothetical protein
MRRTIVLGASLLVVGYALLSAPAGSPDFHFRERRLVSWVSALLLLATAWLLLAVARERQRAERSWLFWEILGWGFVYLAFDEHFQYHERLGALGERHFGSTSWVNHLDDLVLMAYGLVAAALCLFHRVQLKELWPGWLPPLWAAICLLAMVCVDAFSPDIPPYRALEESLKLVAGAGFFLSAYESHRKATAMSVPASAGERPV